MLQRCEKLTEESGQTDCQKFVGPSQVMGIMSSVSPAVTIASNLPTLKWTADGAKTLTLIIPINAGLEREAASRGFKLTSAELHYIIGTAACTAISAKIFKSDLPADGTLATAAEVTSTKDIADASCYDADEHKVTLTPSTPAFIADDEAWWIELILTAANTSVIDFIGAMLHFTRAL